MKTSTFAFSSITLGSSAATARVALLALACTIVSLAACGGEIDEETSINEANVSGGQLGSQDFLGVSTEQMGGPGFTLSYDKSRVKYVKSAAFRVEQGDLPKVNARALTASGRPYLYIVRKVTPVQVNARGTLQYEGPPIYQIVDQGGGGAREFSLTQRSPVAIQVHGWVLGGTYYNGVRDTGDYFVAVRDVNGARGDFALSLTNARVAPPAPTMANYSLEGCAGAAISPSELALSIAQGADNSGPRQFGGEDASLVGAVRTCTNGTGCSAWGPSQLALVGGGALRFSTRIDGTGQMFANIVQRSAADRRDIALEPIAANPIKLRATTNLLNVSVGISRKATSNCVSISSDVAKSALDARGEWTEMKIATALPWTREPRYAVTEEPPISATCNEAPATNAQLLQKFAPGSSVLYYRSATSGYAYRACSSTGCTQWGQSPTDIARTEAVLDSNLRLNVAVFLSGQGGEKKGTYPIASGAFTGVDPILSAPLTGTAGATCTGFLAKQVQGGKVTSVGWFVGRY